MHYKSVTATSKTTLRQAGKCEQSAAARSSAGIVFAISNTSEQVAQTIGAQQPIDVMSD